MHKYLLLLLILLPLMTAVASPDQSPTFDPLTGSYGFASEDFGGGSYLGVDTRDITPDRVSALKLKNESGVEVTMVDQDAPAGKAGIKEHDVILTVNGAKVESVEQLRRMIREIPSGRMIDIGVSRSGQPLKLQAQLAERHASHASKFKMPMVGPMPNMDFDMPLSVVVVHSSLRSGLMVENLTPQLADFFGARNGQGVLVRSVEKGSRAEKAGFRAGDVIVRVGKDPVHDSGDFSHALQSNRSNGSVAVGVIRDKKEQNITLSLPPKKESGDLFPEESFDFPEIDIDAQAQLSDINTQIASIRPEIELAVREAQRNAESLKKRVCEEQKQQFHEIEKQQQEVRKRMREQSSRLRQQFNQEFRKNFDEQRKELRRELKQLQESIAEI
jgi:serine protease Do